MKGQQMRRIILALAAAALAVTGLVTAAPAHATNGFAIGEPSTFTYNGEYLNDWFGGGPVKDWHGVSNVNDAFEWELDYRCDSSGTTTTNCPYQNVPVGLDMAHIVWLGDGTCVGDQGNDPNNANAYSGQACDNSNGSGGGYGTIFVLYGAAYNNCASGGVYFASAHWSSSESNVNGTAWNENSYGNQVTLDNGIEDCLYQMPITY